MVGEDYVMLGLLSAPCCCANFRSRLMGGGWRGVNGLAGGGSLLRGSWTAPGGICVESQDRWRCWPRSIE